MNIVTIDCPHCGAAVERKQNEYFGTCPYCGCEVCFDEAKAEAEVVGLRDKVSDLDKHLNAEKQYKQQLAAWEKKRTRLYLITGVMSFVGFLCTVLSSDSEDGYIAIGVTLILGALFGLLTVSLLRCADCPKPVDADTPKKGSFLKVFGTGFIILCGTAFLSAIIYAIFSA